MLCTNTWHSRDIEDGVRNTNMSDKGTGILVLFKRSCSGKNRTALGDHCGNILKSPLASQVEEEWWLASCILPRIENQWSLESFSSWISMSTAWCQYNVVLFSQCLHCAMEKRGQDGIRDETCLSGEVGTLLAINATQPAPRKVLL